MTAALAVHPDNPARCTDISPIADLVRAFAGTWFGAPAPIDKIVHLLRGIHPAATVRAGVDELVALGLATRVQIEDTA